MPVPCGLAFFAYETQGERIEAKCGFGVELPVWLRRVAQICLEKELASV
ncbi:hypothetical protein [Methylobacillus sp.]|nr:hypothetical protein [Methylobacillus sp.]